MSKNNGSNNIPGWVKRDLQMLKRVSVSLVEMGRENQRRMGENETRMAQNEKMIAEMVRRNDRLEEQTTILKRSSDLHTKAILKMLNKL